jgi:glycerol-3-phosphate dehydrogenase
MNDARMNLHAFLTSSIENYIPGMRGSILLNHFEVLSLIKDDTGKLIGAQLKDLLT